MTNIGKREKRDLMLDEAAADPVTKRARWISKLRGTRLIIRAETTLSIGNLFNVYFSLYDDLDILILRKPLAATLLHLQLSTVAK